MQIKELEEALGVVLVERVARQIRLTKYGEEVLAHARQVLRMVDELGNVVRASNDRLAGRYRIGMIPTVAPYLVPALVADLSRRHPEIDLHVREAITAKLIHDLSEGRIDAAVVALPISEPSLSEVPLFTEHFLLLRPAADQRKPVPSPERLPEMNLLLLEEGHCFRDQALAFCGMRTPRSRESLDASSLSTLVQMVTAGLGLTLIPEMALPIETRSLALSVSRFKPPQPSRTIGMIWRKANPLANQLLQLSEAVRRAADRVRQKPAARKSARHWA